jgi:hypothetical protein
LKAKTKLSMSMTSAQFESAYWYATELKEFAETIGIPELELSIFHRPSNPKLNLDVGAEDLNAPISPGRKYNLFLEIIYQLLCLTSGI